MPFSWRIAENLVYIKGEGEAAREDWRVAVEAILADPRHEPGMGLLQDHRAVTRIPTTAEIQVAASFLRGRADQLGIARWALVVANDASFGMGRVAEVILENTSIVARVFRDRAEAETWARGSG